MQKLVIYKSDIIPSQIFVDPSRGRSECRVSAIEAALTAKRVCQISHPPCIILIPDFQLIIRHSLTFQIALVVNKSFALHRSTSIEFFLLTKNIDRFSVISLPRKRFGLKHAPSGFDSISHEIAFDKNLFRSIQIISCHLKRAVENVQFSNISKSLPVLLAAFFIAYNAGGNSSLHTTFKIRDLSGSQVILGHEVIVIGCICILRAQLFKSLALEFLKT